MAVLRLIALLPLRAIHYLGYLIGRLFVIIPNREREVAGINIRLCMPDLTEVEAITLRDRSLEQAGRTILEMAAIWLWPVERVLGLVHSVAGLEHLQREPGRGLIVLAPHLGCWEIAGLFLARLGPTTALYRPPKKQVFETLIKQARERSGSELVATDANGIKQLYRRLQQGAITGILPDQEPDHRKGAVFAPFFGVPALTMLLVNRLAQKTGAKVVYCFAERLPRGRGYKIHYLPASEGIDDADPQTAAAALNEGVEQCVRHLPDQYQWSYKRFKSQPAGPAPYDRGFTGQTP